MTHDGLDMEKENWEEIAKQLRRPHGENSSLIAEAMNIGNKHINYDTIQALRLKTNNRVLEIGMANGFFVKDLVSSEGSILYTGCDYSQEMVQQAIQLNQKLVDKGSVKFVLANAEKLPFKDQSFDKVFTINTVYFWENQKSVLLEIQRVLKSGGQFTLALRPRSVMHLYPFTMHRFNNFSKEELTWLLDQLNFKLIQVLEKEEPSQELMGQMVQTKSLIITAETV